MPDIEVQITTLVHEQPATRNSSTTKPNADSTRYATNSHSPKE
jgi:hypothetical protein